MANSAETSSKHKICNYSYISVFDSAIQWNNNNSIDDSE